MKLLDNLQWGLGVKTNLFQIISRILLGLALLFAGISHLTFNRMEFVAQVPNWVPLSTDLVVILSGIAEITLGASLIALNKWKALVGCTTAIFFVLIFPGNIAQYVNQVDAFGLDTEQARLIRLFFQPILVAWALWSTGGFKAFMNRNKS
ncbi:DoxX family protein [Saccharicrinis fermentans]|uniref:Putative membrane protein n=1 Tax=Saccharicrinis fermentans DSM 9555 = JCM 21142 TaxID=869213 RepID=W7YMG9_9BACT|nr:membrane protein [Saccharicrinis fermentans]GAF05866.1 putative membrane protein [Saccharicrinis fermentans DSM 9555 = JCM 21142]